MPSSCVAENALRLLINAAPTAPLARTALGSALPRPPDAGRATGELHRAVNLLHVPFARVLLCRFADDRGIFFNGSVGRWKSQGSYG